MKKLFALIVATLMLISLVACKTTSGNKDDDRNTDISNEFSDDNVDTDNNDNRNDNNNTDNENDVKLLCDTHNYVENNCSVCGCSLWTGQTDTSWYSVTDLEYIISTSEQFAGLITIVNNGTDFAGKQIMLTNHIDMNHLSISPIGATKQTKFAGTFNANNCAIANANITMQTATPEIAATYVNGEKNYRIVGGLFGYVTGKISNLNVKEICIEIESNTVKCFEIGGIVGNLNGFIEKCSVSGQIKLKCEDPKDGFTFDIGGAVGSADNASISQTISNTQIDISCELMGDFSNIYSSVGGLSGSAYALSVTQCCTNGNSIMTIYDGNENAGYSSLNTGGLIGQLSGKSSVDNSYSTMSMVLKWDKDHGLSVTGGLIGDCSTTKIQNCYSIGSMEIFSCESAAGGLVGSCSGVDINNSYTTSNISIKSGSGKVATVSTVDGWSIADSNFVNCFYSSEQNLIGDETIRNGNPATTNDLKSIKFYTNIMLWNNDIWNIVNGEYPSLK